MARLFFVSVLIAAAACGPDKPAIVVVAHSSTTGPARRSIDLALMDRSVKPGDDFYLFANGAWYAKAEIDADRTTAGVWVDRTREIEQRTRGLLEEAIAAHAAPGSI